ncbi:heterokaryon incompatibility protein-domain-containing protein [Chaetomium sp. MPI-CAGE-AT-0009]|nr:heterokaryon incompatibility protein-domain-containing protein [Chaetomium sp. MPI-CAGE-AT-0009]
MKLLNVRTRKIQEFLPNLDIKRYAILSHTWAEDEVTFEDFQSLSSSSLQAKKGYAKIDGCCRQAEVDMIDWVWVDTCCIDKRSSAELSEAINSMFRWYEKAAVCYAYLADVQAQRGNSAESLHTALSRARWFTRGWTLQELLAPRKVRFYNRDWEYIGDKYNLHRTLMDITGIPDVYLVGSPLSTASVSMRMSWAAKRETSRIEDMAYCLLGIFNVNMPLLYGEGQKAFRRLQEEIMKAYPTDHTLFAWGRIVDRPSGQVIKAEQLRGLKGIPWTEDGSRTHLKGLFAESPLDFQGAAGFSPWRGAGAFYTPTTSRTLGQLLYPTVTGAGVTLELPVLPDVLSYMFYHWADGIKIAQPRSMVLAILLCQYMGETADFVLLPLYGWGDAQFGRTDDLVRFTKPNFPADFIQMSRCLKVEARSIWGVPPAWGDFILCRWGDTAHYQKSVVLSSHGGVYMAEEGIISVPERENTDWLWILHCRLTKTETSLGFGLVFARGKPQNGYGLGPVSVSLVPLFDDPKVEGVVTSHGYTWISERSIRLGKFESLFGRFMATPEDTWYLDIAPFPLVEVHIRRKPVLPISSDAGLKHFSSLKLVATGTVEWRRVSYRNGQVDREFNTQGLQTSSLSERLAKQMAQVLASSSVIGTVLFCLFKALGSPMRKNILQIGPEP